MAKALYVAEHGIFETELEFAMSAESFLSLFDDLIHLEVEHVQILIRLGDELFAMTALHSYDGGRCGLCGFFGHISGG